MLRLIVPLLLTTTPLAAADPAVEEAIAAVKKLGGKAVVDDRLDETAPVSATFPTGTDALLVSLSKLPSVGGITFDDSGKCTDAGVESLKELKGLKLVRLNNTNVTREGVTRLEAALPKATVRW